MSGDMKILMAILAGVALIIFGGIWMARPHQGVGTYWVDKQSGTGPYQLKTGSRSEEEREKELKNVIRVDGEFEVQENPSKVPIYFSTGPGVQSEVENSPETIPEVKY